jgi:hypothetical protein
LKIPHISSCHIGFPNIQTNASKYKNGKNGMHHILVNAILQTAAKLFLSQFRRVVEKHDKLLHMTHGDSCFQAAYVRNDL